MRGALFLMYAHNYSLTIFNHSKRTTINIYLYICHKYKTISDLLTLILIKNRTTMMKKLFLWSALLMTGFAFYSCDDVIDNPATDKQDPTNPNATWTYEVKISFAEFADEIGYWDAEAEEYVNYKNPTTVFVYNQNFEELGSLTVTEEGGNKYAGILKGAIGDTLIISTLKDFDYYSKQDGTMESIVKYGILQIAKVPIIVASSSTGKIGTQNVKMETETQTFGLQFGDWSYSKSMTITSENILAKSSPITINFAEEAITNGTKYISLSLIEKDKAKYTFEFGDEESGFTATAVSENAAWAKTGSETKKYIYWDGTWNGIISKPDKVDLAKYFAFRKSLVEEPGEDFSFGISIESKEVEISQSSNDTIPVSINIYNADKVTLKDIKMLGYLYINKAVYNNQGTVITVEGNNIIEGTNSYYGGLLPYGALVTFKGNGSINVNGFNYGVDIYNYYRLYDEEGNFISYKPTEVIIEDNVKFIAKNTVYLEYGGILTLNGGTFEAQGKEGRPAIEIDSNSKLNIGTGITSFKATAGEGSTYIIQDYATGGEAGIARLVEDPTLFDDTTAEGVRTIKKK